ncbi:MAG: single-stranded DNA-binding protein [Patescibacteria group bacterium]
MNLNKVFLIGRLAADPESRTTPSGQTVTTVRLATNRVWNNRATGEKQEQVEFHTIVAWSGLADIITKYLRKGQIAFFEGRLQTRSWQGQDGVKRYRTEIVADNMQLGPKAMNSGGGYQSNNSGSISSSYNKTANNNTINAPMKDEDIPVINEDAPVISDPIISDNDIEEKEIDLKDIPF